jgi:integrase
LYVVDDAIQHALDRIEDIQYRHRKGLPIFEQSAKTVIEKFKSHYLEQARQGYVKTKHAKNICSQLDVWSEFLKEKLIGEVDTADFEKFASWRSKWVLNQQANNNSKSLRPTLSKNSLHDRYAALNQVLNWASRMGWIDASSIPQIPKINHDDRRLAITDGDYQKILRVLTAWSKSGFKETDNQIKAQFVAFFRFMSASGLRAKEAYVLQWKHYGGVNLYGKFDGFMMTVPGNTKTGHRNVVIPGDAAVFLHYLLGQYREKWKFEPTDDDFIFCTLDRKERRNYRGQLPSLLKFAQCKVHPSGQAYTLYSLRHRYATTQLIAGANVHDLAKNMGTSVEMIERHYSHVQTADVAERLVQTKRGLAFLGINSGKAV